MKMSLIHSICHIIFFFFALCCTLLISILNIMFISEVSYDRLEKVSISLYPVQSYLVVFLLLFVFFFVYCRKCRNSSKYTTGLFVFLSILYIAFGAYLISFTDHSIRADAFHTYQAARNVLNNDYSALELGSYIHMYPHQIGLMLYDQLLYCIIPNPAFNFSVNLLWILGINFVVWQISREFFTEPVIHQITILLCFGFIPQLFFILFAYGLIPGFFFMILSFYHTLIFCRTYHPKNIFFLLLFAAFAVILKKNYLIGIVAEALYLFLCTFKTKNLRILLVLPLMLCIMQTPVAVIRYYESKSGIQIDSSAPSILYVAMGTDIDNYVRGPGWYDKSILEIYTTSDYQTDKAASAGWIKFSDNLSKIQSHPLEAFSFFKDKTISQWCDPLYQSLWSGPLADVNQNTHTPLLQDLYNNGTAEDIVTHYCKTLTILIWSSALYFLIFLRHRAYGWELAFIYFIGGFLFHFFWEAKSQYIYPYVFCLMPLVAYSIYHFLQCIVMCTNRFIPTNRKASTVNSNIDNPH